MGKKFRNVKKNRKGAFPIVNKTTLLGENSFIIFSWTLSPTFITELGNSRAISLAP